MKNPLSTKGFLFWGFLEGIRSNGNHRREGGGGLGCIKNDFGRIGVQLGQIENELEYLEFSLGRMEIHLGHIRNEFGHLEFSLGRMENQLGHIENNLGRIG